MVRLLASLAFLIVLSNYAEGQSERSSTSTVTIRLVDPFGKTIPGLLRSFLGESGEAAAQFVDMRGTHLPRGQYSYALSIGKEGSEEFVTGKIVVSSPEHLLVISLKPKIIPQLSIDRAIPAGFRIRGKLEPWPEGHLPPVPVWVRLSAIYGQRQIDVNVDATGEFRIYEPLEGRYVLSVIRGDELLSVQQVSFEENWQSAELLIRLPESAQSLIHVRPMQ